jgi:type II secretory pathway pseudopilin PulG
MAVSMKKNTQKSGFALLITLIVVGVVLSVGMGILDLSLKQVKLSTNAKESEIAFHAANAGMECARYWRRKEASKMEGGNATNLISCFSAPPINVNPNIAPSVIPSIDPLVNDGDAFLYEYDFTWGADSDRCTKVTTLVMVADPAGTDIKINNMLILFPTYPDSTGVSTCESGSRCTTISVRGYNKPCTNTSGYGTVEREVLIQY